MKAEPLWTTHKDTPVKDKIRAEFAKPLGLDYDARRIWTRKYGEIDASVNTVFKHKINNQFQDFCVGDVGARKELYEDFHRAPYNGLLNIDWNERWIEYRNAVITAKVMVFLIIGFDNGNDVRAWLVDSAYSPKFLDKNVWHRNSRPEFARDSAAMDINLFEKPPILFKKIGLI